MATIKIVLITLMASTITNVGATSETGCEKQDPRCPCISRTINMVTYEDRCFQFYYGTNTWVEANRYCRGKSGRLIMLNDRDTFQFVRNTLNGMTWNADKLWIGGHDRNTENEWFWTNKFGEPDIPMTFTFWASQNPGDWLHDYNDCVVMKKDGGAWKWYEQMCHKYSYEYKFICEYDMKNATVGENDAVIPNVPHVPNVPNVPDVPPTSLPSTVPFTHPTRHHHGDPPRGGERNQVTDPDNYLYHLDSLNADHQDDMTETDEKKEGHVPLYAVVIAFAGGTVFALFFVFFFILRRRRRRKEDGPFPTVEYHAHPGGSERRSSPIMLGGAVGGIGAPVCHTSGKLCKVAVDMGAEACACNEAIVDNCDGGAPRKATPNVYVSVDMTRSTSDHGAGPLAAARMDSAHDSSVSTINNIGEAPPSYDEVCADIIADHITSRAGDTPYENEELCQAAGGAIPKTPKKKQQPVADYLPMNGSGSNSPASSNRNSHTSNGSNSNISGTGDKDTSQYIHMDRGELPPIPTDDGYEIPVSRRIPPESERQTRTVSLIRPDSITEGQSIYSEIPDRVSRLLSNEEERIYSTID